MYENLDSETRQALLTKEFAEQDKIARDIKARAVGVIALLETYRSNPSDETAAQILEIETSVREEYPDYYSLDAEDEPSCFSNEVLMMLESQEDKDRGKLLAHTFNEISREDDLMSGFRAWDADIDEEW